MNMEILKCSRGETLNTPFKQMVGIRGQNYIEILIK
jgi:hypothetical protein